MECGELADDGADEGPGTSAPRSCSLRTTIRAKARNASEIGRSGTTAYVSRKRRSAAAVTGSRSTVGSITGATSAVARDCGADADADHREVRVGGPPFPDPVADRLGPQRHRLRIAVGQRLPLVGDDRADPRTHPGQVAQVVPAGLRGVGPAARRAADVEQEHAQGGQAEDAADHVGVGAAAFAATEHQRRRQGPGEHRQEGEPLLPPDTARRRGQPAAARAPAPRPGSAGRPAGAAG